jgi:hypothetical protein
MWVSLKTFDEHARDGVRRAIPLAILMYFFQRNGGRDAFWIFFAAYLVMLTPGKNQKSQTVVRVGSAIFGVLLLAVASLIFPGPGALLARDRHPLCRDRAQPALPGVGRRPHDDRLRLAGRRAHRRDRRLGGAPRARHGHRLRDRAWSRRILLWPRDDETDEPVPVTT